MGGVGFRSMSEMAIYRQLLLPRDLGSAAGQTEDKDVTLHDCGVMKYTRSLGQSRIPDNVLRGRARRIKPASPVLPSARSFVAQRGERIDLGCAASGDIAGQHRNTSQ